MKRWTLNAVIFLCIIVLSCKTKPREYICSTKKTAYEKIHEYQIYFPEAVDVLFYAVKIKCPNFESYAPRDMELLSFQKLRTMNSSIIESIRIVELVKDNSASLYINNNKMTTLKMDDSYSSSRPNKKGYCWLKSNSLFDIKFKPSEEANDQVRYKNSIGFIPIDEMITLTKDNAEYKGRENEIDWEATFDNGEYLFSIYREELSCKDAPFRLEFDKK